LAGRIVVMTHRPARIKSIITLTEERPRDINSARLNAVKAELYESMASERRMA
jgi:ABC-type nitrate/sulfonate/bicarbonate transport system ATPase subunit